MTGKSLVQDKIFYLGTDQSFDKNSDQILIIDPIKNNAICQKKRIFCK
jgi:hypothetical protein